MDFYFFCRRCGATEGMVKKFGLYFMRLEKLLKGYKENRGVTRFML
jgi:hypothetical protein